VILLRHGAILSKRTPSKYRKDKERHLSSKTTAEVYQEAGCNIEKNPP